MKLSSLWEGFPVVTSAMSVFLSQVTGIEGAAQKQRGALLISSLNS